VLKDVADGPPMDRLLLAFSTKIEKMAKYACTKELFRIKYW